MFIKQLKQVYETSVAYTREGVVNCMKMTLDKSLALVKLLSATVAVALILSNLEAFSGCLCPEKRKSFLRQRCWTLCCLLLVHNIGC